MVTLSDESVSSSSIWISSVVIRVNSLWCQPDMRTSLGVISSVKGCWSVIVVVSKDMFRDCLVD